MTDINLCASIMCAPWDEKRKRNSANQKRRLDRNGIPTTITNAVRDNDVSIWDTRLRSMRNHTDDATHIVVINDDLMLADSFETLVRQAVAERPDNILSLFLNSRKEWVDETKDNGKNWLKTPGTWGAAIVFPVKYVESILSFKRKYTEPSMTNDDVIITMWTTYVQEEPVWTVLPSLVEHVGHENSTQGNAPPMERTAEWFEKDVDPADVDYTDQSDIVEARGPYPDGKNLRSYITTDVDDIDHPLVVE